MTMFNIARSSGRKPAQRTLGKVGIVPVGPIYRRFFKQAVAASPQQSEPVSAKVDTSAQV